MLDAEIAAAGSDPAHGLPLFVEALSQALADQCSEAITSAVVDGAVGLLARIGDFPPVDC